MYRHAETLTMTTCVKTSVHMNTSTVQLCSRWCQTLTPNTPMDLCVLTNAHVSCLEQCKQTMQFWFIKGVLKQIYAFSEVCQAES